MNLGTVYAEGVLPGEGSAACNLNVVVTTIKLLLYYMLFAPFPIDHRHHFADPPILRTARAWERRC